MRLLAGRPLPPYDRFLAVIGRQCWPEKLYVYHSPMEGTGSGHVDGREYADSRSLSNREKRLSREISWCRRK